MSKKDYGAKAPFVDVKYFCGQYTVAAVADNIPSILEMVRPQIESLGSNVFPGGTYISFSDRADGRVGLGASGGDPRLLIEKIEEAALAFRPRGWSDL